MAVNLESGPFVIVSRSDRNLPIGVSPAKLPVQFVYADAPINSWSFRKVGNKYLLNIGGYPFTGVIGGKVAASIDPELQVEWEIAYQEFHGAYIIALASDPSVGWTIIPESGEVEIRPIIATASIPPQFKPTQLFSFQRLEE